MTRALILCGGGITGALYEVGVLRALEERFGLPHDLFDLFIGISAGATVAAFVSQGMSPSRLAEALQQGDDPLFPIRQRDVVHFDVRRTLRLTAGSARFLAGAVLRVITGRSTLVAEAAEIESALPSGFFTLEPYRRFVARTLRESRLRDDFRRLRKPLLIPATDLDSGHRVVFGEPPWEDVPISTAIAATSAIPVFFEPVRLRGRYFIDGNVGKVGHLDLAIARRATHALIINPLVPIENDPKNCIVPGRHGRCRSLRDRGLWTVYNQAFRVENHVRLHLGVGRFRAENPGLRVVLMEPDPSDATMFLANPMSLAARREVLESAYRRGARILRKQRAEFMELFGKYKRKR